MKHIITGLILAILCVGCVMAAEDSLGVSGELNVTQNEIWTMSPEAALALEKTYATDIRCVDQTYRYLKTGDQTAKKDILDAMYDYNGTVSTWLNTVDNSTRQSPEATADRKRSFAAWTELNQTLVQILSTIDRNETVESGLLYIFENSSWTHLQTFDTLMDYVDEDSFDQNTSRIELYLILMNGLIVPDAYEMTKISEEKQRFSSLMNSFDEKIKLYESRFPDVKTNELKTVKTDLVTNADQVFSLVDEGKEIPADTALQLHDLSDNIWLNFSTISG
nr:hypothetical protein [uncultured Methanospirillum sp.]